MTLKFVQIRYDRTKSLFICLLFSLTLLLNFATNLVGATSSNSWLSTTDPSLTVTSSNAGDSVPTFLNGNPCYPREMKTKKRTPWSATEQWTNMGCTLNEPYGLFSASGYLQMSDLAGPFKDFYNNDALIPIPQTNDIISYTNAGGFQRLRINRDVFKNITPTLTGGTSSPTGTMSYQINTEPDPVVGDANGNAFDIDGNSINFSANGKYMVVEVRNIALVRIDTQTGDVVAFASPFTHPSNGAAVQSNIAISNDGSTVAVRAQNAFKIYDLLTCSSTPATITGPATCESKDLQPFIDSSISDAAGLPIRVSFVDSDHISMYVYHGSPAVYSQYMMTSAGHSFAPTEYLGLGDSFSSGEGANDYLQATNTSSNRCHTSTSSYPYDIANALSISSFHTVACSGATSQNIISRPKYPNAPTPNPLGGWLPGYTAQLEKVKSFQPNVVTLGVGGNDIGFKPILMNCLLEPTSCNNSYNSRMEIIDQVDNEYNTLVGTYREIKSADKSSAKIYAVGYPYIVDDSTNANCGSNVHFDGEERVFAHQLVDHLNYTISQAAIKAGIAYIDASNAFSGHKLCETNNQNIAVNGLTLSDGGVSESYHPNKLGQLLLANMIRNSTNDFSAYTAGDPDTAVTPKRSSTTAQALLGPYTIPSYDQIPVQIHASEIPEIANKNSNLNVHIGFETAHLAPNTSYSGEFHSSPTSIGTFTTDSDGNLDVSTTIPSSLSDGIHTLHFYGNDAAGQPVDVSQTIAIGDTPNDFNGDNVSDTSADCPLFTTTALDVDGDGIDDNCDPVIGQAPSDILSLYRSRQGNTNLGESADKIYVERNVSKASSMLGINDYDPDSDGWSLMGVSSASQLGSIANTKISDLGLTPNAFDEYVPTSSVRTANSGCIELVPSSLAAVTASATHSLTLSTLDASSCRSAEPSADTDNNSIPDNTQVLYRVRAGNISLSESASDIFIERNLTASEAVLGVSDYDDNADGWAKVGKFQSNGTYAKIGLLDTTTDKIVNDDSAAFTQSLLGTYTLSQRAAVKPVLSYQDGSACYNYVPTSTGYVGIGQNRKVDTLSVNKLNCN